MNDTDAQRGTQRFDTFFKNIFKNSINSFLGILNILSRQNLGTSISSELSEEVSKGILRADLIAKTDNNYVLIFEFKNEIKINAYFAINAYTFTHIHTSKAYKNVLSESEKAQALTIPYVPIIIGFSIQKRYKKHLTRFGIIKKTVIKGVYILETNPYFKTYMFVLDEINFALVIQKVAIEYKPLKKYAEILREVNKIEFWIKARTNSIYKQAGIELLNHFGELVLMITHDANYFKETYKFANLYAPDIAKSILDLAVIIFVKKKVDEIMSLAEVLTLEEKKKIIETFGIETAIQAFGIKKVVEAVGIEKVIETVGIEKVIEAVGIEKVVEAVGIEKVIEVLGRLLNLTEDEKKDLLRRYNERVNKK